MYMILLILGTVLLFVAFKYGMLVCKRLRLVRKLKKAAPFELTFLRNILASAFRCDGKPDFSFTREGKSYEVSLITTRYRRVRYHFAEEGHLEIVAQKNRYFRGGGRALARLYLISSYTEIIRTIPLTHAPKDKSTVRFFIPYPVPVECSHEVNNQLTFLGNGDTLATGETVCGFAWFSEHHLEND